MALFYKCSRDGITGIMPEEQHNNMALLEEELVETGEQRYPRPIFTFSDVDREWLTGDMEMMERLLEGHEVVESCFFVPFTHGDGERAREFVTTPNQLEQHFGQSAAAR